MTLPQGADGVNAAGQFLISANGHGDTSISDLNTNDQDTVVAQYKATQIGTTGSNKSVFTSTTGPLAQVFGGVSGGLIGFLAAFLGNLIGVDLAHVTDGASFLAAVKNVPFLGALVQMFFDPNNPPAAGENLDIFTAITNFINNLLQPAGVITTSTPIPPNLLSPIAPNADPNVQQDASFVSKQSLQGHGLWTWDWPGPDGGNWNTAGGCVRTVRPGLITIYWVTGIWQQLVGASEVHLDIPGGGGIGDVSGRLEHLMSDETVTQADWEEAVTANAVVVPKTVGENLIDWERFEVIFVPYAGAMYPMGYSVNDGVQTLINQIKARPGKFILMGGSMGGIVVSKVFQEIINTNGVLHDRNDDLLMGWSGASPMRAEGATWPGNPLPVGPGHGCLSENLVTHDPRWWEWSATKAGSYPAFGEPDGITWPNADPISCLDDGAVAQQVRDLIDQSYHKNSITPNDSTEFFLMLLGGQIFHPEAANVLLGIGFNETASPHGLSWWTIQPFLSVGDERSFWHYTLDYINETFGPLVSPPLVGIHHQLEGTRFPVQAQQVVHAKCKVCWMNVIATGPAIMMAVNAYDASGNLILGPGGSTPSVTFEGATISDPVSDASWQELEASFVIPTGAVKACIVFDCSPETMTTGIVWFSKAEFVITNIIDSALLANLDNFPQILATKVGGVQGEADMLTAIQNLIDGATSANAGVPLTQQQLSALFQAQGVTAGNAAAALALAVAHEQTLGQPTNEPVYGGLSPTGEVTFELQTLPQGTSMPSTSITAGTALAGFITCKKSGTKGFLEFIGFGGGSTSGIYVNLYEVDPVTGGWANVWTSPDISASIPNGTPGWVGVDIPDGQEIPVTQGELVAIEIVAQGATISVVSKTTGLPNKTSVPPNFGAVRTTAATGGVSPATLAVGTPTYSSTHPFVSLGVRNIPPVFQPPNLTPFDEVGTHTYEIPEWAQTAGTLFDVVAVGGGGAGGLPVFFVFPGVGGLPGSWQAGTYVYGTEIPLGTTELQVVVARGGPVDYTRFYQLPGAKSMVGFAPHTAAYDATGPGHGGTGSSMSWSHTATAGAYVVVAVNVFSGPAPSSVTYGGVAMAPLGSPVTDVTGSLLRLQLFRLANVAGGAKTVSVTLPGFAIAFAGNSVSYTGVVSAGTQVSVNGDAHPYSGVIDCPPGAMVVQAFGGIDVPFSDVDGGTNRWIGAGPGFFGPNATMTISDASESEIFRDSRLGQWCSVAIPLFAEDATTLLTANGGAMGANTTIDGVGAGPQTYNGRNYFGGLDVATGVGSSPGGGGSGGPGGSHGGFAGGNGEVWITVRQP